MGQLPEGTVHASDLPTAWRARAAEIRPYARAAAAAFRRAAQELEQALRSDADDTLTLSEAAQESGYSADRLRHMLADGVIPQAGRKGSPRIRRADLPRKPRPTAEAFDATAVARRVLRRMP
jgi:hypothetical protein